MVNFEIDIRKKIKLAPLGEVSVMPVGPMGFDMARKRALSFAHTKKFPIIILDAPPGNISFKRVSYEEANPLLYPEMDRLQIGESHLFELPVPLHQRVRMAASIRNRRGEVLLSCAKHGSTICVTRHPLTDTEIATHGLVDVAPRASRYGLERLEMDDEIILIAKNATEVRNIRVAVSTKGQLTGWKLVCRKIDGVAITLKVSRIRSEEAASV